MRKISKEELRHGTWFRKMMVVTVFLFIAMIAAGAAMQMAEWALSGGNGLAAWLVVFGIFAAAVAGCKAYWKPMVRYCRRKYLTVPVVSGLLDGKEIDRLLDGEVFETWWIWTGTGMSKKVRTGFVWRITIFPSS
mgnify:CR=1 FL=1